MSDYDYLDKYDFIVVDNKILTKEEDCPHLGGMLEGGVKNGTPPSKWVHLNTINTVCSLLEFFYNKRIESGFDGSGSGYFDFIQDFFEVEIVVTTDHCGFAIIANDAWLEGVIGLEFVGGIPRIWYAGKNLDLEGVTKNAKIIQIANFLASVGGYPPSLLPDLNPGILKFISIYLNRGEPSTARFLVESALFLTDKTQLHELAIHGALYLDEGFCPIKRNYYIPQFVWDNQTNVVWKRHAASIKDDESRTIFIDKKGKEIIHTLRVCRDGNNTFYNKVYKF